MDDHYRHFLTSVSEVPGYFTSAPEEADLSPDSGISMPARGTPLPDSHQNLEHPGNFPDPVFISSSRPSKGRGLAALSVGADESSVTRRIPYASAARKAIATVSIQTLPLQRDFRVRTYQRTASISGAIWLTNARDGEYGTRRFDRRGHGRGDWSHLPPDFQRHLNYFVANITNYHYSIANDGDEFFTAILPTMAVKHEPLLHAVVGFSAYHAMLQDPDGQLQDFLKYYNGGVTLLLECLKRKEANNVPTLVTILQLATMEEFLGDWVNLMGHQKAAFEIITEIFEPETVMHTAVGRACLNWYSRYDSYVAIMGGFPTELSREWFDCMTEYSQSQVTASPDDLRWRIDDRSARLRSISYDMSMLYARGSRGQISLQDFCREHQRVTRKLHEWRSSWDPALMDPKYLVTDFYYRKPLDPGDIVDPYKPGVLFKPPLFTTTLIAAEWHSIMIMHLSQAANMPPSQLFVKFGEHAFAACQYFESVEFWPSKPKGSMVSLQPCISIAALFLPQDSKHQMWIRRKFACLDILGCIHPTTRRIKMAKVFRDPSCAHWWLPNDEGLTPVLQSIRAFADERNAAAVDAQVDNIREVRHLFAKLEIGAQDDDAAGSKGRSS
ncbi:fungal specific transcription factor [Hirsutella rhossiliensis]|uniref:Fungal specific transcription factor domain-containing protein n=1 Tax=Hirsutella rhossiliensis TaxID=111463 RepID=A0A9P8N2I7_9HYPO|nr:fungal specific transcription factor domain-containing protein [Hirsutella rhossiliensis]KAH0965700.1 fungal specific transcription factor domain-containing protein [Hirsutella rhossiliensis]